MTDALFALAFSAGALAFAAPCAFPLLPGYVAFFVGASGDGPGAASGDAPGDASRDGPGDASGDGVNVRGEPAGRPGLGRAAIVAGVTGLGATVVFVAFAALVAAFGAVIAAYAGELELVVGALVVLVGVALAAGRSFGSVSVQLAERSRSLGGFFAFGVTYGVAAAGCSAPVFVGVALAGASRGPATAAAVVGTYTLGLGLALTALTLAAALGHDALLQRVRVGTGRVTRAAGVLLVLAGLAQIHYAITVAGAPA